MKNFVIFFILFLISQLSFGAAQVAPFCRDYNNRQHECYVCRDISNMVVHYYYDRKPAGRMTKVKGKYIFVKDTTPLSQRTQECDTTCGSNPLANPKPCPTQ